MTVSTQKNVVIVNKSTGEEFYGEDPYILMEELAKKHEGQGTEFEMKVLNPKYRFLMK